MDEYELIGWGCGGYSVCELGWQEMQATVSWSLRGQNINNLTS